MTDPLEVARLLIRHGIPVFVAKQAKTPEGEWDSTGEYVRDEDKRRFVNGYLMPRWTRIEADERELRKYRDGDALGMVCGHGFDVIDVDTHKGGAESLVGLYEADMMPTAFAIANTPSGGEHHFIRSLGVRSLDGLFEGIDLKAGIEGVGHGFVFIAPTVKFGKDRDGVDETHRGVARPYEWVVEPDFDAMIDSDDDGPAEALAAAVNERRGPERRVVEDDGIPGQRFSDYSEDQQNRLSAYVEKTLAGMESDLRASHSWPERGKGERKALSNSWEELCFYTFKRAARLAKAQWNPLTLEEARRRMLAAAPKWEGVEHKWEQQVFYAAPALIPFDPAADRERSDTTLTGTDGNPIVESSRDAIAERERRELEFENRFTDSLLAERVVESAAGKRIAFTPGLGWIQYTKDSFWRPVHESVALVTVSRELRKLHEREWQKVSRKYANDPDRLRSAKSSLKPLLATSKATAVARLVKGYVTHDDSELDAHPTLFNCANGVVDLETGELRPHDPALLLTKYAPTNYVPGARHPDWDAAIQAIPDDVRDWLQERYGQGIVNKAAPGDVILVQVGGGANGKSTVMEAILKTIGSYGVIVPHRVLLGSQSDHPTELMVLRGASFAVMEETPEERHINTTRLKSITGTTITARLIRKDSVEFTPTHSMFINTNYLPLISGSDYSIWRRLLLVNFPYRFRRPDQPLQRPNDRRGDVGLRERLQDGKDGRREAVLAWLVEGIVRWNKRGESPAVPARVQAETDDWQKGADPVAEFIDEYLEFRPGSWVVGNELYQAYAKFLESRGYKRISDRTFFARFGDHEKVVKYNDENPGVEVGRAGADGRIATNKPGLSRPDPALFISERTLPRTVRGWVNVGFATRSVSVNGYPATISGHGSID